MQRQTELNNDVKFNIDLNDISKHLEKYKNKKVVLTIKIID